MIIRKEADGGLMAIPQTEHSRFVGQLAAHWGNDDFAAPTPFETIARAATYHDFCHLDWEPDLPFDSVSGEPLEFRKIPDVARQVAANQWCVDWLAGIDAYSGFLVSRHATGLRRGRYGTIKYPTAFNPKSLDADMEAFIARNEAWQEEQQRSLPATWPVNFHLLQVWDLLGLYFGCQEPGDDYITPVPLGYAQDSAQVTLKMKALGDGRIAFDPYPFDHRPFKVQIIYKRLSQAKFADQASYRKAYYKAATEMSEYTLV